MLKVIACWNNTQIIRLRDKLIEEKWLFYDKMAFVKGEYRINIVHQFQLKEKILGINADILEMFFAPSIEELAIAQSRTYSKRGQVYILGRKVHDWREASKEETEKQKNSKKERKND